MQPIADDFGPVSLPPTDPRSTSTAARAARQAQRDRLKLDAARKRIQDAGFRVADHSPGPTATRSGAVVGTTPKGKTIPRSIITISTSNGIAPAPVYVPPR